MRAVAAATALALAGPAAAEAPLGVSATYVCERGAVLRIAYLNPPDGAGMAVVDWAGRLVPMRAARTGSGVLYVDLDAQRGLRWRGKGDEGSLLRRPAGDGAAEERLLSGCALTDK